ncbi:Nicastrin [Vespula squamosa]|uniref:Nicastrin n=1 Tax=Vespula squamosa TaxID=30214 RepID=A0ABD2A5Q0_VESSQ
MTLETTTKLHIHFKIKNVSDYNNLLVYKYEVGGWAPPTELSQSPGAAAHTYTWFSLTTYLLI